MSLDTVLTRLGIDRHDPHSLEAQIHALQREIHRVGRTLSHEAGHRADLWGDQVSGLTREAARHGAHLAEEVGHQAWRGARAVRRDPLPAIAVLGTALLLARLFQRR